MVVMREVYKLLAILSLLVFGGIVQYFIIQHKKKKKAQEEEMMMGSNYNGETTSNYDDSNLKTYIEQYKSQFSRDSIKASLISAGNSEDKVEEALNKYF